MSLMSMLKAQSGINIDPATLEYMKKMQGQTVAPAAPTVPAMTPVTAPAPEAVNAVEEGQPGGNLLSIAGDALSTIGQSSGNFGKDSNGVTEVSDTGDITGGAIQKGLKTAMATGNPLLGAGIAALSFVGGKVQQGSERRRAGREENQLASDFQRAQQGSSVYADPNSVYYSAKNGGGIMGMMTGGKKIC